jgi:hypothetical protein
MCEVIRLQLASALPEPLLDVNRLVRPKLTARV